MTRTRAQDLIRGTVDIMILKALQDDELHGHDIAVWIAEHSDGAFELADAALYQALHRMESKGLLKSSWGLSENNRRAKFYRLSARGQRDLEAEVSAWSSYSDAVRKVLEIG